MHEEKTSPLGFVRRVADALNKTPGPRATSSAANEPPDMQTQTLDTLLGSGTLPSEVEEKSNEEQLIDALDQAALSFARIMLDDRKDEDGKYLIDWDSRIEVFKMVRDWVATRRRTDISDPKDDQSGVKAMQDEVARAREAASTSSEPPRRGRGRPSNAELKERERLMQEKREREARESRNDDSGLAAELKRANGSAK